MRQFCDLCAIIPSDNMQIIEDLHLGTSHAVFTCLRRRILNHANAHVQVAEARWPDLSVAKKMQEATRLDTKSGQGPHIIK